MITIAYIEMTGFRGFRQRTRFELPRGFAVFSGRNGAGKSTAFDAIDYVLTGSINKFEVTGAKGGGLNEHLWWIGDGFAEANYVAVGFRSDKGDSWEVRRGKDGRLTADIAPDLLKHLCTGATADWAQTLMKTSLIRDERISAMSLDLTEQARFTAVRAALGTAEPLDQAGRFKALVKLAEDQRRLQETVHQRAHDDLGRSLTAVTEARSASLTQRDTSRAEEAFSAALGDVWITARSKVEVARAEIARRRTFWSQINLALADAERVTKSKDDFEAIAATSSIASIDEQIETARSLMQQSQGELADLRTELAQAEESDARRSAYIILLDSGERVGIESDRCPLCASQVEEATFRAALRTARAVLSGQGPDAPNIVKRIEELTRMQANLAMQVTQWTSERSSLTARRAEVEREVQTVATAFRNLELGSIDDLSRARDVALRFQEKTAILQGHITALESSSDQDRLSELSTRTERQRVLVEEEALKLAQAERALERSLLIEKAAKVVANEMLTEQLDTVAPLLKELYLRLRPHADWREIEIDVTGQVRASLNFSVGGGKNPQFLFSSGQRRAAGLAFLLAIYLSRPWCGLKCMMLDDPVQHVDDYRALNLVEVLASVRRSGEQILVAVEDEALADLLCRRLLSTGTEAGKRFQLSVDLTGSSHIAEELDVALMSEEVLNFADAS